MSDAPRWLPLSSRADTLLSEGDGSAATLDVDAIAPEETEEAAAERPLVLDLDAEPLSADGLHDRVTIMLLFEQVVRPEQVQRAWREWKTRPQQNGREPLWRRFTNQAGIDQDRVYAVAAKVYAFREHPLDLDAALSFLREYRGSFTDEQREQMLRLAVVPVAREPRPSQGGEHLIFATFDPTRPALRAFLRGLPLRSYELRYVPPGLMRRLLRRGFSAKAEYLDQLTTGAVVSNAEEASSDRNLVDEEVLEAEISRSALLALFDAMVVEAVRDGASDIHIVPGCDDRVEIFFRIDGDLQRWHTEDRFAASSFVAVLKDQVTGIDRFERDAGQDGYLQRQVDGSLIRFRVSVLPIAGTSGEARPESVVVRVLDDRQVTSDLRDLGLPALVLERLESALRQPHGMVIATGPTGSGKSTTLRAALHHVVSPRRNVLTVEDPVEYVVPGVRQIRVSHKLLLEDALRFILRHDPDVVMVGEMRDRTTAELAIKLSNTGHLTFSTLHTNDAASAISRLAKLGIEPYLLAHSVNLIVAQRLIRILCPACKRPYENVAPDLLCHAGFDLGQLPDLDLHRPGERPDCETCGGSGYKGRRAIVEALELSETIRSMIVRAGANIDEAAVREQARSEGMSTLLEVAREMVGRGETALGEMMHVAGG